MRTVWRIQELQACSEYVHFKADLARINVFLRYFPRIPEPGPLKPKNPKPVQAQGDLVQNVAYALDSN